MREGLAASRRARLRRHVRGRRGAVGACCAVVSLVTLLAACGPAASGSAPGAALSASRGNAVTYAMEPGGQASYPFPFMGAQQIADDSVFNVDDFQYLLYRPLYWFGTGVSPYLNRQLSLAQLPVYHGHEVIIRLKHDYKWSNGEQVDARDVVFWLNMMIAEGQNDAYYSSTGLPSDITNVRAAGKFEVTMDITTAQFSQAWFTSNELSEVTPMPMAWDVTRLTGAAGSGGCASDSAADGWAKCKAVFNFLTAQSSKNASTLASSPLWKVVDGPWQLQSLSSLGKLVLTFNKHYSGPVAKGHITTLTELPFTSEQAEYNVLQDPTGNQAIDVGYLPTVDAPAPPAGALAGPNPPSLSNYNLTAQYLWQLSYMPYNFNNTTGQGAIFDQLYFRQAFQHLVDQEGVINGPLHGYGKPTVGPVTFYPQTKYLAPQIAAAGDEWTLNISAAENLLKQHGWTIRPNGTDTCARPGTSATECGANIPAGTQLKLTMIYAAGTDWMQSAARELASNASLAGIALTVTAESFNDVIDAAFGVKPTCTPRSCAWQLAFWGSWTYAPDYLPTGDTLFLGHAPNNAGNYNSSEDNQLIADTLQARTPAEFDRAMHTWDAYLTKQLPVVYEPDAATLIEAIKGLDIGPQNSADTLTPEFWHYLK